MFKLDLRTEEYLAYLRGLQNAGKDIKAAKAEFFNTAAEDVLEQVDAAISDAYPEISGDTVQNWQGAYVGTQGGYVAVRPRKGIYKEQFAQDYPVSRLTAALERGAKARFPSGRDRHYRKRVKYGQIRARHFYRDLSSRFKTPDAIQIFVNRVIEILTGW